MNYFLSQEIIQEKKEVRFLFELTDHLGSVRAVVKGVKNPDNTPQITQLTDYYAGGWDMPGRSFTAQAYKFGYQGSEKDAEINAYTTYFRMLDPRVGRWFSPDPVVQPWQSPYCAMDNSPLIFIDPLGNIIVINSTDPEFLSKLRSDLTMIARTEEGYKLLKALHDSPDVITIEEAFGKTKINMVAGTSTTTSTLSETQYEWNSNDKIGKLQYSPNDDNKPIDDTYDRSYEILFHELKHSYQDHIIYRDENGNRKLPGNAIIINNGVAQFSLDFVKQLEEDAVSGENYLKAVYDNVGFRKEYTYGEQPFNGTTVKQTWTFWTECEEKMFNPEGESIKIYKGCPAPINSNIDRNNLPKLVFLPGNFNDDQYPYNSTNKITEEQVNDLMNDIFNSTIQKNTSVPMLK